MVVVVDMLNLEEWRGLGAVGKQEGVGEEWAIESRRLK